LFGFCFCLFGSAGVWTQGLVLAVQSLYYLRHILSPQLLLSSVVNINFFYSGLLLICFLMWDLYYEHS
jgi:hypothetical protein